MQLWRDGRGGSEPAWLEKLQRTSMADLRVDGFPGVHDEDWKYTASVATRALDEHDWQPARMLAAGEATGKAAAEAAAEFAAGFARAAHERGADLAFFVDGRLSAELSNSSVGGGAGGGARVIGLAAALADSPANGEHAALLERHLGWAADHQSAITQLNTGLFGDGALVLVPDGCACERAVELVFFSTGNEVVAHPRVLVVAGAGSSLDLTERYVGVEPESENVGRSRAVTNPVTELLLERDARVTHLRLQDESKEVVHLGRIEARVQQGAEYNSQVLVAGGRLVRSEVRVRLEGRGARTVLRGLSLVNGRRLVDFHTLVEHVEPGGSSDQLYRTVLAGNGRGVFTGRVVVHEGASGSNAGQRNDALLLSDGAHASSRPQLEIYNDDVSCTHGATTGQLDERSLFYLRQRGLSVDEASSLLARAFATEALQGVLKGELLDELEKLVAGRLATGSAGVNSYEVSS